MKDNRVAVPLFLSLAVLVTMSCFLITTPRGPLKFDPVSLPAAHAGMPYDSKIGISGN